MSGYLSESSYDYHEGSTLDDNGVWQNSSGSGYVSAGDWIDWSVSGSASGSGGSFYGNSVSGTVQTSGSGHDGYDYTQYFNATRIGQWQLSSGVGNSYGVGYSYGVDYTYRSGSVTHSFSASGAYSSLDPGWAASPDFSPGQARIGTSAGSEWSGSVSASGQITLSADYIADFGFKPVWGWIGGGSATAWVYRL